MLRDAFMVIGEPVVEELRRLIRKLGYRGATWEWSIWERGGEARLHFLKITLTQELAQQRQETLFSSSGLTLFRAHTPIAEVEAFADYCLSTRRIHDSSRNKIPVDEPGFQLATHRLRLFGNFTSSSTLDFFGGERAKNFYLIQNERPFFIAEYALHDSVRPQLPGDLGLHGGSPPFSNPRDAYRHYFGVHLGDRTDPWVGIVAPVYAARIKSFRHSGKHLTVDIATQGAIPDGLFLSVVCRHEKHGDFRTRAAVSQKQLRFPVAFRPMSCDLALFLHDVQIDFVQSFERRRRAPIASVLDSMGLGSEHEQPAQRPGLFTAAFLGQQHPDVRWCLEHADGCVRHGLWVPASVMLRKALEMAVNLKLMQLDRGGEIHGGDFERPLTARLEILGRAVPKVRPDIRDLPTVKWFGDRGAHSRMDVSENDVRAIIEPRLRSFLTHLELKGARVER